jgi:hypothetical protein
MERQVDWSAPATSWTSLLLPQTKNILLLLRRAGAAQHHAKSEGVFGMRIDVFQKAPYWGKPTRSWLDVNLLKW